MPAPALATRAAGLERLAEFLPRAGARYARTRNVDFGPDNRENVSGLSPWLRLRLLRESEVIAAAVAAHGEQGARKFVEEVCWRTYFKGWLEQRPSIWSDYRAAAARLREAVRADGPLADEWGRATAGATGIDAFDAWCRELTETGYLHNHARMWFASIWIFTLGLPWQLGADWFMEHLLDGDPASNTLSWRWVAGLHTRGRTYLARRDNIRRYTDGRFDPGDRLSRTAPPLTEAPPPRPMPLAPCAPLPDRRLGLLLTDEDLHPESLGLPGSRVAGVAAFSAAAERAVLGTAPGPVAFARAALDDALARSADGFEAPTRRLPEPTGAAVAAWAADLGVVDIVLPWPPVGPSRTRAEALRRTLEARGLRVWPLRRAWDEALWPAATGGYFGFRQRALPEALRLARAEAAGERAAGAPVGP